MRKYELTSETKIVHKKVLYRIKALKNFNNIKLEELGGFVQSEKNLSQEGNCWIYDDACVFDNAQIEDNVQIYNNAKIYDQAHIWGNVTIYGQVHVYNHAKIADNVRLFDNVRVFNYAIVKNNAKLHNNVQVYDRAIIFNNAYILDNVFIYNYAKVHGRAHIYDDVRIYDKANIGGYTVIKNQMLINKSTHIYTGFIQAYSTIKDKLIAQCYTASINNKVILFKRVNKISKGIYNSLYDKTFIYKDNQIIKVDKPDISNKSCATGLHLSYPTYWDKGDTLIACEVDIDDIITIQEGKVRCSKCKVLGEIK